MRPSSRQRKANASSWTQNRLQKQALHMKDEKTYLFQGFHCTTCKTRCLPGTAPATIRTMNKTDLKWEWFFGGGCWNVGRPELCEILERRRRLHPERRWQMFKRILVSRIENDVHHPSADETETMAKMPHPRAIYSYSVHVYVYGLHIQMYICMLYINSNSSRHCAYRPTTKS